MKLYETPKISKTEARKGEYSESDIGSHERVSDNKRGPSRSQSVQQEVSRTRWYYKRNDDTHGQFSNMKTPDNLQPQLISPYTATYMEGGNHYTNIF